MNHDEIRQLLPFYAAGTLDSADKAAVEEALHVSPELQEELHEWQLIRNGVIQSSEYASHHLAPNLIVAFAEGTLTGKELDQATLHFRECTACTGELETIRNTFEAPEHVDGTSPSASIGESIALFLKPSKVRWAFGLAMAAAIWMIVLLGRNPSSQQSDLLIDLVYTPNLRGESQEKTPLISLTPDIRRISFTVHLPHSGIANTRFSVSALTPEMSTIQLPDTLTPTSTPTTSATIAFALEKTTFGLPGRYQFVFKEEFRPPPDGVEPVEYVVPFEIRGSNLK